MAGEPVSESRADDVLQQFDDYISDASFGRFTLDDWDVTPTLRMPQTRAWYEAQSNGFITLLNHARSAALQEGLSYLDYWTDAVVFNRISGGSFGGWAGRAYVGWRGMWLNGDTTFEVTTHELGHNLGAGHANYIGADGAEHEYFHPHSVMGFRGQADFSVAHKRAFGWIDSGQTVDASSSQTVRLFAHDEAFAYSQQAYGISLDRPGDRPYWLEYHSGIDDWSEHLVISLGPDSSKAVSVVDGTPNSIWGWYSDRTDAAIGVGSSYHDDDLAVTFSVVGSGTLNGNSWLDVRVTYDADLPSEDRFEASGNDSFWNPVTIGEGQTQWNATGLTIHDEVDEDWFEYTATRDGRLNIRLDHQHGDGDLGLTINDRLQQTLAVSATDNDEESAVIEVLAGDVIRFGVASESGGFNSGYGIEIDLRQLPRTIADFNQDGHADLVWRNAETGGTQVWFQRDGERIGATSLPWMPLNWELLTAADFNDDGATDLLWRRVNDGKVVRWSMNENLQRVASIRMSDAGADWRLAGVGDFNQDGELDLTWSRDRDGIARLWLMADGQRSVSRELNVPDAGLILQGVLDHDLNGSPDLLWRRPAGASAPVVTLMSGLQAQRDITLDVARPNAQLAAVADLDGDGRMDLLWRNPDSGANAWWTRGAGETDGELQTWTRVGSRWTLPGIA